MIETLRATEATVSWLDYLEKMEPPFDVELPGSDALPYVLRELDVPEEDIADIIAMAPSPERTPETWWLLARAAHSLVRHMGAVDGPPELPMLPEAVAGEHRFFFVHVFLATLPHVRAYHRSRGIPDTISRASLADLGRSMREYRRAQGAGGLNDAAWLMIHFRGLLYQLGRLQFERRRLGRRIGATVSAAGLPYVADDPALGVHIPGLSGPLAAAACDASFAAAVSFCERYFPEDRYDLAVCDSWLLDPQLAEYLPAESNIMRFQRRFRPAYRPDVDHEWILRFVYGRSDVDLDAVPQRTILERAVANHLKAGRTWHGGVGWFPLRDNLPDLKRENTTP